ncbi:MAG TPA: DUF6252 family protein [Longimicrobiales bacterium]|nr:DUF6252 family protein [Longimicrobiales bacterium]
MALILAAGCGSDGGVADPVDELEPGSIVGTIDGRGWSTANAFVIYANGRLVASGTGSQNLAFGFGVTAQSTGTYATGGNGNASAILSGAGTDRWEAAVPGGSGTLTITSFSSDEVAGTFSFNMVRTGGAGAPDMRTITDGRFRVRY